MKKIILLMLISLSVSTILFADDSNGYSWPKEIKKENFNVTLYQPQLESFKGNILEGRMALSVKQKDKEAVFGSLWFKARLATNLEERTAVLENLDIKRIYFPGVEDTAKIEKFSNFLVREIESGHVVMSLDRLLAGLKDVEDLKSLSVKLNNDPPDIYFRTEPAVLVSIDGDPIMKEIEGAGFEYVVNTAFFIVKEKNKYYIKGEKFWYVSTDATSGYTDTKKVPYDIEKFAKENLPKKEPDSVSTEITQAPKLIVATKPSELVTTDGEPDYAPIEGTTLLYITNTSNDIIMDINSQNHYVLLAGRWFFSKSLKDGDWKFAEPDQLPADFAKIPRDSDMADVLASVPGTPEAQDALLEQTIPQTATVDKKTAKLEVKWDGDPKFKKIKDTDVSVSKNSDKTVLLIQNKYYCVDDAIWFVASKPTGPWTVSDVRPDEVDQIPPESEAYNVKYVYIYETTPEVVYVGYLPGYTYSYPYGGCVFYGTGYWYRPWYGHYYYPRPVTFGFGVHWNPYSGWGFSFGFSYGWIGWGFHPYSRAYWGPRGYYPGYRHGYARGYHHGYYHGARHGYAAGYRAGQRNSYNNVYHNRSNGVKSTRNVQQMPASRDLNKKARPSAKPNNVYTDKKGNIYQRDKSGNWQNKNNSGSTRKPATKPAQKPVTRPAKGTTQKPQTRPSTGQTRQTPRQRPSVSTQQKQQLNRSYQNRSHGNQNYNRARSSGFGGSSRGGGMSRGGARGGRR